MPATWNLQVGLDPLAQCKGTPPAPHTSPWNRGSSSTSFRGVILPCAHANPVSQSKIHLVYVRPTFPVSATLPCRSENPFGVLNSPLQPEEPGPEADGQLLLPEALGQRTLFGGRTPGSSISTLTERACPTPQGLALGRAHGAGPPQARRGAPDPGTGHQAAAGKRGPEGSLAERKRRMGARPPLQGQNSNKHAQVRA